MIAREEYGNTFFCFMCERYINMEWLHLMRSHFSFLFSVFCVIPFFGETELLLKLRERVIIVIDERQ